MKQHSGNDLTKLQLWKLTAKAQPPFVLIQDYRIHCALLISQGSFICQVNTPLLSVSLGQRDKSIIFPRDG